MRKLTIFVSAVTGLLITLGANAAEPRTDFVQGTRTFTLSAAYVRERHDSDINMANAAAGYGLYVLDNVALELQVLGYRTFDEEPGAAVGSNLVARWHVLNCGRFSLFGNIAGGIFQGTEDFPDGGTHFNFTYRGGPGLTYRIRDQLFLIGGIDFQHVSNAFIAGRDRNPVFNSFGGQIGLMWTF